jgi:hypothetical protein
VTTNLGLNVKAGLQLWLDGKDQTSMTITGASTVTQWRDKSGLFNHTTSVTGTPQLGVNGITFSNSYFNLANECLPFNDTNFTMYIIVRSPTGNAGLLTAGNGLYIAYDSGGARLGFQGFNGGGTITNVSIQSSLAIYTITYSSSGYNYRQYINGIQSTNTNGNGPRNQTSSPNQLGFAAYGAFGMIVGEMLVFNSTHTTSQRENVEGYLAWKWGIQTTLPSNHPYLNSPPGTVAPQAVVLLNATNYSGSGAWLDESGNGKNATRQVGTIAKSAAGNSLVFDGSTAWTLPNLNLAWGAWTASVWYKPTGTPTGSNKQFVFGQQDFGNGKNNIVITYDFTWSGALLRAGYWTPMNGGFFGANIPLTTNNWVHIVSTYDGNIRRTYANNVLLSTNSVTIPSLDGGAGYVIGGYFQAQSNYVVGEIGHVSVYNGALSQSEVSTLFNQTKGAFIP